MPSNLGHVSSSSVRPLAPTTNVTPAISNETLSNNTVGGSFFNNITTAKEGSNVKTQFLKETGSLTEKAAQANVSPKVGVQTPFSWFKPAGEVDSYTANATKGSKTEVNSEHSTEANFFVELEKEGIIQYPANNNDARLTQHGQQLYRRIMSNPPKDNPSVSNNNSQASEEKNKDINEDNIKKTYVAGIITKISPETEILTSIESHVVVAEDTSHIKPTYDITTVLTSNRGVTGDVGVTTTVKLSNVQFEGQSKGQYAYPLSNPVTVDHTDFIVHDRGTNFINNTSVVLQISNLDKKAKEMTSVDYNKDGITREHLQTMLETHKSMENFKKKPKENDNDKDNELD